MSHEFEIDAKFLAALAEHDAEHVRRVQRDGCADCGGPLDRADYPRKAQGVAGESADVCARRLSLCCRCEGCRKRATPPSLRFLGRKVYIAVVVIIASAAGRTTPLLGRGRARTVQGVPLRTVRRWLSWWQTAFALGVFWTEAKSFFASRVEVNELPASLLERFDGARSLALERMLRFIAPITTTSVRASIAMVE